MSVRKERLLLSIDVEDWFQAESFSGCINRGSWNSQKFRAEENVNEILQVLDDFAIKATFFCLGWVAERLPALILDIANAGHEIASHGYYHHLIYKQTPAEFRQDITQAKRLLEDITNQEVIGYRAPTFSVTDWSFPIIQEAGYKYDSSVVITNIYDRYSSVFSAARQEPGDFFEIYQDLYEFSLPCLKVMGKSIPWGGGGYFRLFPLNVYLSGLRQMMSAKDCVFYFNTWELDVDQPRVAGMSLSNQFRHYVNLDKTHTKLRALLAEYRDSCITFNRYLRQFNRAKSTCLSSY